MTEPDKLHYIRFPGALGGRAEMVRLAYVLADKPYVDVLHAADAMRTVRAQNPYQQVPFVETADGEIIAQTIAIMQHAGHGTPVWPSDAVALTRALQVAMGAYDLYQAFGGFAANDAVAKAKFEERRAPQYFNGLTVLYTRAPWAAGDAPSFADCLTHEAVAWCARRNDVSRGLLEASAPLQAFMQRFDALPAVAAFMAKQAAARGVDDAV